MFIPLISSFKIKLSSKLSMYSFSQVVILSLTLLLCKFPTTTNNMIYTFIYFFTHSTQRIYLAFVNLCFNQICSCNLILSCHYKTLSSFSNLHSEAKPNTDHFLLLQSASNTDHVELSPPNLLIFSLSLISTKHLQLLNHLSCLPQQPVSIFPHFHEHTQGISQHKQRPVNDLFPIKSSKFFPN